MSVGHIQFRQRNRRTKAKRGSPGELLRCGLTALGRRGQPISFHIQPQHHLISHNRAGFFCKEVFLPQLEHNQDNEVTVIPSSYHRSLNKKQRVARKQKRLTQKVSRNTNR